MVRSRWVSGETNRAQPPPFAFAEDPMPRSNDRLICAPPQPETSTAGPNSRDGGHEVRGGPMVSQMLAPLMSMAGSWQLTGYAPVLGDRKSRGAGRPPRPYAKLAGTEVAEPHRNEWGRATPWKARARHGLAVDSRLGRRHHCIDPEKSVAEGRAGRDLLAGPGQDARRDGTFPAVGARRARRAGAR